jgi:hypothetical protein
VIRPFEKKCRKSGIGINGIPNEDLAKSGYKS